MGHNAIILSLASSPIGFFGTCPDISALAIYIHWMISQLEQSWVGLLWLQSIEVENRKRYQFGIMEPKLPCVQEAGNRFTLVDILVREGSLNMVLTTFICRFVLQRPLWMGVFVPAGPSYCPFPLLLSMGMAPMPVMAWKKWLQMRRDQGRRGFLSFIT